jgi:F420-dependent oxidoreductase-like protein
LSLETQESSTVRIGLMIGPEKGRYREKVDRLVAAAQTAERERFTSVWFPQVPNDFDALTAIALMGRATTSIELGTAVVPIQTRHPVAMAQQALSTQAACEGRLTLGLGPSHHWIVEDMLGLSYERPAHQVRNYLDVLNVALAGPGPVDVENDGYRVHNPLDITDIVPTPILVAALAPVMLRIAGELASGTILWMADERAIGDHVVPRLTKAAAGVGRPAPRVVAGVPVTLCRNDEVDDARVWANRALGHAEYSPNYQRLLEHGDATDVGDILAGGDEAAIVERLEQFRDAGVTDLAVRVLPLGTDRESRIASWNRTEAFVSSLCPNL